MNDLMLTDAINGLAAVILLTAFVMVSHNRMQQLVRTFALQSIALAAFAAAVAYYTGCRHIYIVAVLTLVLKGFIIPRFLNYTIERSTSRRRSSPWSASRSPCSSAPGWSS